MNNKTDLEEAKLTGFSENAKNKLKKCTKEYMLELIKQARLIESMERIGDEKEYNPEINATHVLRASKTLEIKNSRKTKNKVIDIFTEVSLCVTGLIFDIDKMKESTLYMIIVVIVILVTTIFVCMKYFKEV